MDNDTTKPRATQKDFFLHLGTMVTLYASAAAVLTLLFQVIDYAFPDNLFGGYYGYNPFSGPVRWSIATLIVMFPLLWLLSRVLNRDFAANPAKRDLGLRKWLVYLTLFVTGLAIAIDLIALINTFLGGEITARFSLKVLSVLVVTGLIFGYYVHDIRKGAAASPRSKMAFLGAGALLVIFSIVAGFMVMGSPAKQRKLAFDGQKTNDLQSIQWQVVNHWQRKGALPATLSETADSISGYVAPSDPETGEPYEYRVTGPLAFELCAEFNYASSEVTRCLGKPGMRCGDTEIPSMAYPGGKAETWEHEAGKQCFARTIDPELYPLLDAYGRPTSARVDEAQIDAMVRAKAAAAANSGVPQYAAPSGY